ncbi:hypothetical protein [Flavobacterium sp.]|uniref:hypothetical protein n=1 Tax=Flavobacterium sp. TaxID=239 RepID=UPI00286C4716|nr:hypothetical protein [Flavobacterium sp.]
MKNSISILAIALLMSGSIFTSCKSAVQKEAAARQNVDNAKENVTEANEDLKNQQQDNEADWKVFKAESEAKILANEQQIEQVKVKMNKPSSTFDGIYRTRIEKLEASNVDLKSRINNYDANQTGWDVFKKDFNRDMDELGKNIKDVFN